METIHCCGDTTFKYLTRVIPELVETIILQTTSQTPMFITNENSEVIPTQSDGKKGAMDILCSDELGNLYNLEMQRSSINELQILRFMYYSCSLYVFQAKMGKPLKNIQNIYTIVLSENGIDYPGLIRHDIMNCENQIYPGIRQHLITVNMPYIKTLKKEKELKSFTSFERIIYALYSNLDDDILKIDDRMVNTMNEKLIEFLQSDSLAAFQALKDELVYQEELERKREFDEREKVINEKEKVIDEKEKVIDEKEKVIDEKEKEIDEKEKEIDEKEKEINVKEKEINEERKEFDEEVSKFNAKVENERADLEKSKNLFVRKVMALFNFTYDQAQEYISNQLS